ncbi:hypothetical protein pdam_00014813 [Pocillopora damicornis]|uniref:Death domain-containing protein n=1 Tax=Pocillopora damicornis TaxID=46731 RepID=A0A3M6UKJ8_POCDA|nr:hypothetical protein pdam_00014813 [Pocillopora damicornis]
MTDQATSYSIVGTASGFLGDVQQAKDNHVRELNIRLKNLGPDHVDVAASYSDLGTVCGALGEFQQAKEYHSQALDIRLKNLGSEHVDVATSFSGLGTVCGALGEFQRAKDYHGRALNIYWKKLGPEHVDVAASYNGLGTVFCALGEFQQAKNYHGRALDIRLKNLGPEHADVAASYSGLGTVCGALGELQQAKDYHGRALDIRLKNLGPKHVGVAASYSALGTVFCAPGEFQQAKDYHGRALDIRMKNLGPEHVYVAASYSALGTVTHALGEFQQAKDYHGRALDIRLKKLGPEHDFVALSYSDLGTVCSSLGDLVQAKDNFERARNIFVKRSGPQNIYVAMFCRNLATICDVIGTPKQAKHWNERAQTILSKNNRSERADVSSLSKFQTEHSAKDWNKRVQTILRKNNRAERADVPSLRKFQITVHSVPPYILARGSIAKAAYQRALETGKTFDKRAKILLIGQDRVGKTSVLRSLKGELFRQDESSTLGLQIDMPLKHVGEKPWKNSKEEQEKSTFHYKCALNISNQLLTEPPNEIYVDSEVTKQTETDETQRTEGMIGEIGSNQDHDIEPRSRVNSGKISPKTQGDNGHHEKRNSDMPDEVVRLTTENLSRIESVKDDGIWPVCMDFGGQAIYRAIHPILASREAVYLLVVNYHSYHELTIMPPLPQSPQLVPVSASNSRGLCGKWPKKYTFSTSKDEITRVFTKLKDGNVVYHGRADDPLSLVVLNPRWLIDVLCQIITVEKQEEEKTVISNLRKDLGKNGILDAKLLDYSCTKLGVGDIKESLLFLMKKFNLLCEYTGKDGSSVYLVPCMLTSTPDDAFMPDVSVNPGPAPVYVTFSTQYVPGGLFSRMVVLFFESVQRRIACDQAKLWANSARFYLGDQTAVDFVCYKRVIKVHVWNFTYLSMDPVKTEPKVCSEVLSFLKTSLERLHEECHWLQTVSWDLCARCDLCPREFVHGTGNCYWHAEVECCHDDCAHYVSLTRKPFVCTRTQGPKFCPPKTWSQVLDDANGKNLSGQSLQSFPQTKAVSSLAQCSSVHFGKRVLPYQTAQSMVPAKIARTGKILKEGILSKDDHMGLSNSISEDWRRLGLLLGIRVEDLDNIDQRRRDYFDKAHQMLRLWMEKNASNATYRFLCQALCHQCLNRRDLAERFCFR